MFHDPAETQLPSIKRSFYEKKGISDVLESLSGQGHTAFNLALKDISMTDLTNEDRFTMFDFKNFSIKNIKKHLFIEFKYSILGYSVRSYTALSQGRRYLLLPF